MNGYTNWTPQGIPGQSNSVVVGSGSLVLSAPVTVVSVVVSNNATLVFSNWTTTLTAPEITVLSNGVITHALCNTNQVFPSTNRVYLVTSNLTINTGGRIDVTGKGYAGMTNCAGQGPGGGGWGWQGGPGGGHGGTGGRSYAVSVGGVTYDTLRGPTLPGSAGGCGATTDTGGSGGGAVYIQASGLVTLNGDIRAAGASGVSYGGGGSGGSVYIICRQITGNGSILVNGGNGPGGYAGGGGGGRMEIQYDTQAQRTVSPAPALRMNVHYGQQGLWGEGQYGVNAGTIVLPDSALLMSDLGYMLPGKSYVYGVTNWSPSQMTVTNSLVIFCDPGFALTVTNNMMLDGYIPKAVGGPSAISGGVIMDISNRTMNVGNNLIVTNGAALTLLQTGLTNGLWNPYGAKVQVGRDIRVTTGAVIYAYAQLTNGGGIFFSTVNLFVGTGGVFSAKGLGYGGAVVGNAGYGPGGGSYVSSRGGGGGYGGRGGGDGGGSTYGSSNAPTRAGSGGAFNGTGAAGGGVIWIDAFRLITLDGVLDAGGNLGADNYGGGGAGGSIYLRTRYFGGGGSVRANGGNGGAYGNGGGGGRIAIWRTYHLYTGTASVTRGLPGNYGSDTPPSEDGTIVWGDRLPAGSFLRFQ